MQNILNGNKRTLARIFVKKSNAFYFTINEAQQIDKNFVFAPNQSNFLIHNSDTGGTKIFLFVREEKDVVGNIVYWEYKCKDDDYIIHVINENGYSNDNKDDDYFN